MDKKSNKLIWFFILLILLSILGNYYRVFVLKEYDIVPIDNTEETTEAEPIE